MISERTAMKTRLGSPLHTALLAAGVLAFAAVGGAVTDPARAAGESAPIEKQEWTFAGPFGYYDEDQLRRGFKVYNQVCASCHGMRFLKYRDLMDPDGPNLPEAQAEAVAAQYTVMDGPDDQGQMFERPATLQDTFASPYKNDKEAALVNNGVVPPDLSLMAQARGISSDVAWYMSPVVIAQDLLTMYAEQGPDYIHALLTGYEEPPEGEAPPAGLYYNVAFPGQQLAMPQPLYPDSVPYPEGVPTTVEQYSRDVTAFLMWAAEPTLEERKQLGAKVMLYLFILAGLLYMSKRLLWKRIKH